MGFPIELDVRLLGDGRVAVFHDEDTLRMTGSRRLVRELRARDLDSLGLLGTGHRIPLLEEVLDTVNGQVPLLIELKPSDAGDRLGEAVLRTLEGYEGEHALQCFDPRVVRWLRRHAPETPRGQLVGGRESEGVPLWKSILVERSLSGRLTAPDFFGCGVERLHLRAIAARRRAGTPVLGWTVRSPAQEVEARLFCDNVIFEGYVPKGAASRAEPRAPASRRRARSPMKTNSGGKRTIR
jgi:glycerophosphoryl diester phosphodiesterase